MKYTQEYCRIAKAHRDGLRSAWAAYDEAMKQIERYKGSEGYNEEAQKAVSARDAAIQAQKKKTADEFTKVLSEMGGKVDGYSGVTFSDEDLRILQAFKLRSNASREEFKEAGRAMQNSHYALRVLNDIAREHGYYNLFVGLPGWQKCDNSNHVARLRESANAILRLEKPNSRREVIRDAVRNMRFPEGISYDRDFATDEEALSFYGGFDSTDAMQKFANVVDD